MFHEANNIGRPAVEVYRSRLDYNRTCNHIIAMETDILPDYSRYSVYIKCICLPSASHNEWDVVLRVQEHGLVF